ncbi:MAG: hypothetical protein FJ207_03320 [Gemmatimonadetes bacterium]|nr:hypothetical protein [Gemmatimonadota bacterium]
MRAPMTRRWLLPALLLLPLAFPSAAAAKVTGVVLTHCEDVLGGRPFGTTGAYEKCTGTIFFSLDPRLPRNAIIADLDKAPRDPGGAVGFSSDIFVLRPKDPSRGNGVLFFDVVNRGNKALLSSFNLAAGAVDPTTEAHFGDGYLMREGYTLVAVGWEPSPNTPAVALHPPVATDNGRPITGEISQWFIPLEAGRTFDLAAGIWTGMEDYPPLDPRDPDYSLTVREGFHGAPRRLPRESWEFGRMEGGQVVYDPRTLLLWTGFEPGYTYELAYETKDPRVIGVGAAAIRDAASYFKYEPSSPVRGEFAYALGSSQTGRSLRQLIYDGFTVDEQERKALDAVFVRIAGASLGTFNQRFGQPNEGGGHNTTRFPIRYESTRDPATGRVDGLGARIPAGLEPKIVLLESSSEYWDRGRVSALNHTTLDGLRDLEPAENVRFYLMGSFPHGTVAFPPRPLFEQQLPGNPLEGRFALRAILAGLDRWVREGVAPPANRHPTLAAGTLVAQRDIQFPAIPGVHWPRHVPGGYRSDLPGKLTDHPLPFLVPNVDADGNETSGIVVPDVTVPLATFTGWAFRSERAGLPGEIQMMAGSYIPFPRTRAERQRTGDPRLSIEERYTDKSDYLRRVEDAARRMVGERLMLAEDVERAVAYAGAHWDFLMTAR